MISTLNTQMLSKMPHGVNLCRCYWDLFLLLSLGGLLVYLLTQEGFLPLG